MIPNGSLPTIPIASGVLGVSALDPLALLSSGAGAPGGIFGGGGGGSGGGALIQSVNGKVLMTGGAPGGHGGGLGGGAGGGTYEALL